MRLDSTVRPLVQFMGNKTVLQCMEEFWVPGLAATPGDPFPQMSTTKWQVVDQKRKGQVVGVVGREAPDCHWSQAFLVPPLSAISRCPQHLGFRGQVESGKTPGLAGENWHHCRGNHIYIWELSLASADYLWLAREIFPYVDMYSTPLGPWANLHDFSSPCPILHCDLVLNPPAHFWSLT
jgi:hypothetical protein